jgi:hypothetical protein
MFKKLVPLIVLSLAVFIHLVAMPNARASVIYDWTGDCSSGCVGTATGVLTLADTYTPGTAMSFLDFDSFSYSSSSGTYDIPGDGILTSLSLTTLLPVVSSTTAESGFGWATAGGFTTNPLSSSAWVSRFDDAPIPIHDIGQTYNWQLRPVPLPAAIWLFGSALIGLVGLSKRRKAA